MHAPALKEITFAEWAINKIWGKEGFGIALLMLFLWRGDFYLNKFIEQAMVPVAAQHIAFLKTTAAALEANAESNKVNADANRKNSEVASELSRKLTDQEAFLRQWVFDRGPKVGGG